MKTLKSKIEMSSVTNVGIVIGAARAGTTWLNSQLDLQRDIYTAPVKEVRHFTGSPNEAARHALRKLVEEKLGKTPDSVCQSWLECWEVADSGSVDDYRKLMLEIPDRPVAVDVSPIYCTASPEIVGLFKKSVEQARILIILRNPVDCSFSLASRLLGSAKSPIKSKISAEQFDLDGWMELFSRPAFRKRVDFLGAIRNWSGVFGADSLRIEFFENIKSDPSSVVRNAVEHFGGRFYEEDLSVSFRDPVGSFPGEREKLPEGLKERLAVLNRKNLEDLAHAYPEKCGSWYAKHFG